MKLRFLFNLFLLAAVLWPVAVEAQFQTPTKEELAMTADEKAPGASAVFLYREDVTDRAGHSRSLYERIKVLTEKGKELATVQLPFEPDRDKVQIDARTIHADGVIVPLTEAPSDIVDWKVKKFQEDTLTFTLPSVEVGSILEYRITERTKEYPDHPTWFIQQHYYVHKAHYAYRGLAGMRVRFDARLQTSDEVKTGANGDYTLDVADIAPLPEEDWMPPLNTLEWRVSFYYANFPNPPEFWNEAGYGWGNFVLEFTKPTGALKTAAERMVGAGDSPTEKAKKIYAAVLKLENTDFTREKSRAEQKKQKIKDIRSAQDVWQEQGGNSNQIALLFVALCRVVGLDVGSMKVVDRSRALFDHAFLSTRQLNDFIAVGRLDGKEVFFDPGEKVCPFGMLHWRHMLTSGFRQEGGGVGISRTPLLSLSGPSIERVADLTIDESGAVRGAVRVVLSGQEALYWRQLAIESDEEEVKKRFNEWMSESLPEGVQASFDHFLGLENYESNLLGMVQISGNLGTVTGRRIFLPGLFFEVKAKHPFVAEEKRVTSVDVHYARAESDEVTYRLPTGYKVESSPQKGSFSWPDHAGLVISANSDQDSLTVSRDFERKFAVLDADQYEELRKFYRKVAEADQQQVVLVRAATGNGN